jgi:hypothetical protein
MRDDEDADAERDPRMFELKPLGDYYKIVLATDDCSFLDTFLVGAFRLSSKVPVPELDSTCVCCDAPTNRRLPCPMLGGGRMEAAAVPAPVCEECEDHALGSTSGKPRAVALTLGGLAGAVVTYFAQWPLVALLALIIGVMGAYVLFDARRRRIAGTCDGHHPGFELYFAPEKTAVHTTNPRLAKRLSRHPLCQAVR